jgi:hypothetical protein
MCAGLTRLSASSVDLSCIIITVVLTERHLNSRGPSDRIVRSLVLIRTVDPYQPDTLTPLLNLDQLKAAAGV